MMKHRPFSVFHPIGWQGIHDDVRAVIELWIRTQRVRLSIGGSSGGQLSQISFDEFHRDDLIDFKVLRAN